MTARLGNPLAPTVGVALAGNTAAAVLVRRTPLGVRTTTLGTATDIDSLDVTARRDLLGFTSVPGNARVVVSLPSSICALRPIGLGRAAFRAARQELAAASGDLFPFPADETDLGFIELVTNSESLSPAAPTDDTSAVSGCLVAVHRPRLDAALTPIAEAMGRPVHAVLSPHMAMLGLGLQSQHTCRISEVSPFGQTLIHELCHGLPVRLARPALPEGDALPDFAFPDETVPDKAALSRLAEATALASAVAPAAFLPLRGPAPSPALRWLPPAALAACAALLASVALSVSNARYNAAADAAAQEQAAITQSFAAASDDAAELERIAAVLQSAQELGLSDNDGSFDALAAAITLLPQDAYLERIAIEPESVRLVGGAARAQQVLRSLEQSPRFARATQNGAYVRIGMGSVAHWESFDLSAERSGLARRHSDGGER